MRFPLPPKMVWAFLLMVSAFSFSSQAQTNVGVGTASPDPSAILDITSSDLGILVPRMTSLQRSAIPTPATGLLVYDVDFNQFWYYDGTAWVAFVGPAGPTGPQGPTGPTGSGGSDAWSLTGNTGTIPGTGAGENFIGTIDLADWIIATNSIERIHLSDAGTIEFTGDFINQELTGTATACTTNVASPATPSRLSAASLGLPTNIGGVTTRSNSQALIRYNTVDSASILEGTTVSITLNDSSGVNHSGLLIVGSVAIRTLNTAVLPNANRFQIWLQRSNDNFVSNSVNVWRTESAVACGLPTASPYNMASGNTTVPIFYTDLNLVPGTYSYRLVFQGGNYGTGAGVVNYEALDRSLILLQIKR